MHSHKLVFKMETAMKPCVHFVGFNPNDTMKWDRAVRVWGQPDFMHAIYDYRVKGETMPGDTVVFARGDDNPQYMKFYPYTEDEAYANQMRRQE